MKLKRIISLVLALALMMSMVSVNALVSFAEEAPAGTYFYSSFEEGVEGQTELPLLTNTVDSGKKSAGLGMPPVEIKLLNDFTKKVANVEGNTGFNAAEGLGSLIDSNSGTKYLTNTAFPVNVIYTFSEPQTLGAYSLTSANDAQDRDPYTWTVAGSNDKETWVTLDSQDGQVFADRYVKKLYEVDNTEAYLYYRLQVTRRYNNSTNHTSNGMMQIADWNLGAAIEKADSLNGILVSENSTGPQGAWNNFSGKGWTGANALKLAGTQIEENAHSWNVIYDDVNVAVSEKTNLSYMIYPDYVGGYDYDYTSHHIAVDIKFTDGTYLSDLNAKDQNGDVVSPENQGEARALFTKQWNIINSKIGEVANGKIVDQILVGFEKNGFKYGLNEEGVGVLAYIDDIKIEEKEEKVYENALAYTMTRRGSESTSSFSRGLNHPGVLYPNGFNFWTMCSANNGGGGLFMFQEGHDITHISTSHQASYWTGERGTVQFMVNTSANDAATRTSAIGTSERMADYNRDTLVDQANYLKIDFNDGTAAEGATIELVPTDHAASVKFTFDEDVANRNIIFDSVNTNTAYITFNEDGSFTGYTQHCSNGMRRMHFYGTFSVEPAVKNVVRADRADAIVTFPEGTNEVVMNMATSFISADQAKHNLELEIGSKTWDQVYDDTEAAWLDIMDRVEIEGASEEELITFWSSMYRLYMYPNNLSENLGTNEEPNWAYASPYRGSTENPTVVEGYKFYYNNGFWDTARTTPGAYALLTPTLYTEFLNGFVQHYIDSGWLPRWVAPGGTNSMVGTNSDEFFADALMRGMEFDYENAYLSALRNGSGYASNPTNGGRQQTQLSNYIGYVNSNVGEGFSWSMEGYNNDAGIAKMAAYLGDNDNAVYYQNRALNYTKLFNSEVDFFMGRKANGDWTTTASNFNPKSWRQDGNYTETNGWNMAFHVKVDGQGLANLYGGKDQLEAKLDAFFTEKGDYDPGGYGGEIHEMKEAREVKLGQYGHSNQPSHHIIFMYNYANAPAKTQFYARDVLDRLYVGSSIGQGFCGDADNGESSAWYIQAALGIYPVNMGSGNYTISSPLFDKVTIHQENGSDLEIIANNNSQENVYVQSVTIDGVPYNSTVISHEDFTSAKQIVFEMGNTPSTWGEEDSALDSITQDNNVAIPMDDMTTTNVVDALPGVDSNVDAEYIDVAVNNAKNLFDNDGGSYVTFNGNKASIYTSFAAPRIVEMYTISNYESTTNVPDSVALYASNDGETWIALDESDVTFRWPRYVEPFAVENSTAYKYYRLDLSSDTAESMNIAEVELYGYIYKTVTKDDLLNKINEAKALNPNEYGTSFDALNAAIDAAEALYNEENPATFDMYNAINDIDNEMSKLEKRRNAFELIEAESYSSAHSGIALDTNNNASGGYNVGGCQAGFWIKYNYLDFANGASEFVLNYARQGSDTGSTPHIDLYIDAPTAAEGGTLIGTFWPEVTAQNNWANYKTGICKLDKVVTGVHDLYFMLKGDGAYVANLDYFTFNAAVILDVAGDLEKIPNSRRTLEITTTSDVNDIVLYDADGKEIETSYVGYTDLEDGNRLFEVDVTIDNTTAGDYDITIGAVTATAEYKQDVTLKILPYVTSASTDADEYVVGSEVTFTIIANEDVAKIGLANEYGKYASKISESVVDNGDGTNTWTIVSKFDSKGSRTINIYAAGPNLALVDTGFSVDFVVDIAVSGSDDEVEVLNVVAPESAKKNEVFTITVTTSTSATKVGIFSESGKALGKISQTYVDKDGERVWTIALKVGSKGARVLAVKATDATGVWSEAQDMNIKIK